MIISFKYRVKDASVRRHLERQARACNFVWNYLCQIQRESERSWHSGSNSRWPSAFDLMKLTAGASKELGILADTINVLCLRFGEARKAKRRCPRFRAIFGGKRALGWVPLKVGTYRVAEDYIVVQRRKFRFWKSRPLEGELRGASFVEDARGRWYIVFQCKIEETPQKAGAAIGIDLGIKTFAALSDGRTIENPKHFAKHEAALAKAQRAGNKPRVRAIHAKIANSRKDFLHKQSTELVRQYGHIVVGNVNSARLKRTRMAKSVSDAGWSSFRLMLSYKCQKAGASFTEADERYTSQVCSSCGSNPVSSPKGIGALGVRRWECTDCGASHDRDTNAALNILRVGLSRQPPVAGMAA